MVTEEFLPISEARRHLEKCMFGNLPRPGRIRAIKRDEPRLRIFSGDWAADAGFTLRDAATSGDLAIYVVGAAGRVHADGAALLSATPTRLSRNLIDRLLTTPTGIPDQCIRPQWSWIREGVADEELLALLEVGTLVFEQREFIFWCEGKRLEGKWPSQLSNLRRDDARHVRKGRPRASPTIEDQILALARGGQWTAADGISALHRLLTDGGTSPGSYSTIQRRVDELYRQTLETGLERKRRFRRDR